MPEPLPWGQAWPHEFWDAKHSYPPCCNPHQSYRDSHFNGSQIHLPKENPKLRLDFAMICYHMDDYEPFVSPQPSQDLSHPSPLISCSMRNTERTPTAGRDAATQPSPGPVSCGRIPSANYPNHSHPLQCRENNRSDSHTWKDVTAST